MIANTTSEINPKSLVVSGAAAGITIIIVGTGLIPILGDQMDVALEKLSVPPLSNAAMAYFGIMSFLLGVAIMWIYALIYHNFKTSLSAALTIALFFWFFTYFWSNAALVAYGFLSSEIAAVGTAYGLIELIAAAVVGSKIYRPKGEPQTRAFLS